MDYNSVHFQNLNSEIKSHILIADINKIKKFDKIKTETEIDFPVIYSQIIQGNIII